MHVRSCAQANVDVSDSLVNGAQGEVVHTVTNNSNEDSCVLVKFDNERVGLKSIQTSPHRSRYLNAAPSMIFAKGSMKWYSLPRESEALKSSVYNSH